MAASIIDFLRRTNKHGVPEDSIALRATVLAAVVTATGAVAAEGAISPGTAVVVVAALALASWVSHRRRHKDNFGIKIAVTFGALVALARLMTQISALATLDEVRFPLAELFLWVQVLHSLDLPARKDLNFSLGSSLTLMGVAASLSQDLRFGAFLIVYSGLGASAMALAHRSELSAGTAGRMVAAGGSATSSRPRAFAIMRGAAPLVVAATVLWLVIPQPQGSASLALPFSLGGAGVGGVGAGIINPGFSSSPGARSNGSGYYGFNDRLDLRVRGELSDEVVMRVRASAPALWRGVLFDHYDGTTWSGPSDDPVPLEGEPPFGYPIEFRSLGPRAEVTQTYYVEVEQPSAIFAAGQPDSLYFDSGVSIDALGGLRTDQTLTEGTVYSVISSRGAAGPASLRGAATGSVPQNLQRYLQVPDDLPGRVGALAERITGAEDNNYDRVKAVERYLAGNYRYSLDSPVPEPGRDAVDHFLYDTDIGFCEQFATATAVMLRTQGIPARLVAGYTTGSRNPFSGYYEVKGSDAHTWVEVWFPGHGWYEFDPTFAIPPARQSTAELIPLVRVVGSVVETLARVLPGGVAVAAARAGVTAGLIGLALVGLWVIGRRRRRTKPPPAAASLRAYPGPVTESLARLEVALAAGGAPRAPSETAAEMLRRTAGLRSRPVKRALETFELERYGNRPPAPGAVDDAVLEIDRLADAGGPRRGPPRGPQDNRGSGHNQTAAPLPERPSIRSP